MALAGVTASHVASSDAVTSSVPAPCCDRRRLRRGVGAPCVAENARVVGETDNAGGAGGSTVKVTGIVFGEPVAPSAVTVTSVVYVPAARPVSTASP